MSLDGLRAWIGEVERKLRMRTRVFLVLAVIAIGAAGAAIYLAIDTRENAVSQSDVRALQEKLEARIGEGGGVAGGILPEAESRALHPEGSTPPGGGGSSPGAGGESSGGQGGGSNGSSGGGHGETNGSSGGSGKGAAGGRGGTHKGASTGGGSANAAPEEAGSGAAAGGGNANGRLQELLEHAKEANEKAEREQAEGK